MTDDDLRPADVSHLRRLMSSRVWTALDRFRRMEWAMVGGESGSNPVPLLNATASLLAVWILLALAAPLEPVVGPTLAVAVTFLAATLFVVATGRRPRFPAAPVSVVIAAMAGFASYVPSTMVIAWIGLAVGLAPRSEPATREADAALWVSMLVLAPVFEEILYRQRVLSSLQSWIGAPGAVIVSSALFAVPHVDAWSTLGTFVVGIALGAIFLATETLAICIAVHAGLNLAALIWSLQPE
jgi:membrane protease YdiL (CAAX protease family)